MRCAASPRSSGPAARPIAHSLAVGAAGGTAGEAFALAGRRAARARTSRPRWRLRSVSVPASPRRPISLQLRAGGDLPALLRSLARRLDERRGVNAEIRALTAQARLSARVVPLLPVVGLALAALLDAGAVRLLLTTAPGLAIVAVAAVLDLVGLLAIRAIARGIG